MHFLGTIGHFILTPLYYAISVVLVGWHSLFSLFLPAQGGMSWVLSIVGKARTVAFLPGTVWRLVSAWP